MAKAKVVNYLAADGQARADARRRHQCMCAYQPTKVAQE